MTSTIPLDRRAEFFDVLASLQAEQPAEATPDQFRFQCLFCNLKQHADVQGARTLVQRRSLGVPGATFLQRRSLLLSRIEAFQARYPRPRGGPADPRWTNPYFTSKGCRSG